MTTGSPLTLDHDGTIRHWTAHVRFRGSTARAAHGPGELVDRGLVVRAQHGDRDAFERIVDVSFDRCRGLAVRLLRDTRLAEDAVQQAMVNIWRDLPRLRDPERYDAWSYTLLLRACYGEYRKAPRWMPAIGEGMPHEPRARDEFGAVIDRDQLERGFRRLSMDHRVVLVLHHYLDLPLEQVASVVGVPIGTVKSRLHRAIAEMRAALEADARPVQGDGRADQPLGPLADASWSRPESIR
jgi:RNA polymerase sigma-70 factor, ECF subfamily